MRKRRMRTFDLHLKYGILTNPQHPVDVIGIIEGEGVAVYKSIDLDLDLDSPPKHPHIILNNLCEKKMRWEAAVKFAELKNHLDPEYFALYLCIPYHFVNASMKESSPNAFDPEWWAAAFEVENQVARNWFARILANPGEFKKLYKKIEID